MPASGLTTPFEELAAVHDLCAAELLLMLGCVAGVVGVILLLGAAVAPSAGIRSRGRLASVALVAIPLALASVGKAVADFPEVGRVRRAQTEQLCARILRDVADGSTARMPAWSRRTVEASCGRDALVAAASAPNARFKLNKGR